METVMTKDEAEFLLLYKRDAMTAEEQRDLGKWWRRKLRSDLTRLRPLADLASSLRAQGKQDLDGSCRAVAEAARVNRRLIIEAASALAGAGRYAEFRADFEDIAAQAETLPV
jgi:hypothetical protein